MKRRLFILLGLFLCIGLWCYYVFCPNFKQNSLSALYETIINWKSLNTDFDKEKKLLELGKFLWMPEDDAKFLRYYYLKLDEYKVSLVFPYLDPSAVTDSNIPKTRIRTCSELKKYLQTEPQYRKLQERHKKFYELRLKSLNCPIDTIVVHEPHDNSYTPLAIWDTTVYSIRTALSKDEEQIFELKWFDNNNNQFSSIWEDIRTTKEDKDFINKSDFFWKKLKDKLEKWELTIKKNKDSLFLLFKDKPESYLGIYVLYPELFWKGFIQLDSE